MTLLQAAEQARLFEHEGELTLAKPRDLPHKFSEEVVKLETCLACGGFIDAHGGVGRKPHTCGRMECKRLHRKMMLWRRKNKKSRAEMVARLAKEATSVLAGR